MFDTLERPFIVFDTETTSINYRVARIIEIAHLYTAVDRSQKEWRSLINPGIPIPPESTKIHHITDAMVQACRVCQAPSNHPSHLVNSLEFQHTFAPWPTFAQVAASLAKGYTQCDFGGKRIRYDLQVLSEEMRRAYVQWTYVGARIIDADRLEQLGEPRTLSDLYQKHCGKPFEDAHSALSDVKGTAELLEAQMRDYPMLPRTIDALHAAQWPDWIDLEGKFRFVNGTPCLAQWGKYAGRPMSQVPNDYWDFMVRGDFSAEVKHLASQAKMKQYPLPGVTHG